jgi:hypothetical protein
VKGIIISRKEVKTIDITESLKDQQKGDLK